MVRAIFVSATVAAALVLAAACGGDGDDGNDVLYAPSATATPASSGVAWDLTPSAPSELRVGFINLMSPVTVDADNTIAAETYDQRLTLLIEQLKPLKLDIIGFNEATKTTIHGNVRERLAKELKMEFQYVRANPWFPTSTKEQNDELVKQIGFEEGELILSRYPILRYEQKWLNPRTSETEGRAALHIVVSVPGIADDVDVYITHLTGGGDRVRTSQAGALLNFIATTRGQGPTVIMGDLSETPGSPTPKAIVDWGMTDVAAALPEDRALQTCCRESVAGEQPPVASRTDYIFADRWKATSVAAFADAPGKRVDGSPLYSSDHNGLFAVFPITVRTVP